MLILERRPSECVIINDDCIVKVLSINGNSVKLGFDFPPEYEIWRAELKKKMKLDNINGGTE